jgi:hypothetical protein
MFSLLIENLLSPSFQHGLTESGTQVDETPTVILDFWDPVIHARTTPTISAIKAFS